MSSISRSVLQLLSVTSWCCHVSNLNYGSATLDCLPARMLVRLHAYRFKMLWHGWSLGHASNYDHVTPLRHALYWLRIPERITCLVAVLVYRCQHGLAPACRTDELRCAADIE